MLVSPPEERAGGPYQSDFQSGLQVLLWVMLGPGEIHKHFPEIVRIWKKELKYFKTDHNSLRQIMTCLSFDLLRLPPTDTPSKTTSNWANTSDPAVLGQKEPQSQQVFQFWEPSGHPGTYLLPCKSHASLLGAICPQATHRLPFYLFISFIRCN